MKRERKILYEKWLAEHTNSKEIESEIELLEFDEFNPIRHIFSCIAAAIRNLLFLFIIIGIVTLAGIGATSLWYQPTRELIMQLLNFKF